MSLDDNSVILAPNTSIDIHRAALQGPSHGLLLITSLDADGATLLPQVCTLLYLYLFLCTCDDICETCY